MLTQEAVDVLALKRAESLRNGVVIEDPEGRQFTIKMIYWTYKAVAADGSFIGQQSYKTQYVRVEYADGLVVTFPFKSHKSSDCLFDWVASGRYKIVGYNPAFDDEPRQYWRDRFKLGIYQHSLDQSMCMVIGLSYDASGPKGEENLTVLYMPLYRAESEATYFHMPVQQFFGYVFFKDRVYRQFELVEEKLPSSSHVAERYYDS